MFGIRPATLALCLLLIPATSALCREPAATGEPVDAGLTAAAADSQSAGNTVLLPVLAATPDTGLMIGGTVLRFFNLEPDFPESRPSVLSPVFIYTLKNQIMVYLGLGLNWDRSRNALDLVPNYVKFPDQFYGLGREADLDREEDYTSERFGVEASGNRRVWRHWRLGLDFRLLKHNLTEVDPAGQLAGGSIAGTANSWSVGAGPTLALDSRDHTWAPQNGLWLQAGVRRDGVALGSDYTFQECTLDLRGYRQVGTDLVVAGQCLAKRLTGDVPFFALPRLGGDSGLRGYRAGLYMDRACALARLELRRSRLWGRLGAVAFAGIGDVAPAPNKFTLAGRLWTLGGGLRFLLAPQERVNIRLDFGLGNGDSGFFMSLGEAF